MRNSCMDLGRANNINTGHESSLGNKVAEAAVLVEEWMSHGPDRHGEIWGEFMERERRRFEMAQRAATERAQLG